MVAFLIVAPLSGAVLSAICLWQINDNMHVNYTEPHSPCQGEWERNLDTAKQFYLPGLYVHKLITSHSIIE